MRRLSLGSLIRMKAFVSKSPSGVARKSDIGKRGCFFHSVSRTVQVGRTLEEERYRNLQNVGDLVQPARFDAISALLVFLHLLDFSTLANISAIFVGSRGCSAPIAARTSWSVSTLQEQTIMEARRSRAV